MVSDQCLRLSRCEDRLRVTMQEVAQGIDRLPVLGIVFLVMCSFGLLVDRLPVRRGRLGAQNSGAEHGQPERRPQVSKHVEQPLPLDLLRNQLVFAPSSLNLLRSHATRSSTAWRFKAWPAS